MKITSAPNVLLMRFWAAETAWGLDLDIENWIPPHTNEPMSTRPTPLERKRIMAKVASSMPLPLPLQPMSMLVLTAVSPPPHVSAVGIPAATIVDGAATLAEAVLKAMEPNESTASVSINAMAVLLMYKCMVFVL